MNARQKAKKYKKKINDLKSDNDLMRRIIRNTPGMQELYDLYNKPKFVTHTTIQVQEYRAKRVMPSYMADVKEFIEHTKQAVAEDLFEGIKENITYEIDDKDIAPTITASIFIGKKE